MNGVNALIVAAMPEEMATFRSLLDGYTITTIPSPGGDCYLVKRGSISLLLLVSRIGMVSAASKLTWALTHYLPRAIINIGSAGGLSPDARVGQVVIGSQYVNGGADGTAFGYARGQVPGQPAVFPGSEILLSSARDLINDIHDGVMPTDSADLITAETTVRIGQMLSSDFFVTDSNVGDIREAFPEAITADMESQAFAQVANVWGIPFISVRGISDLCGEPDEQSVTFHAELSEVAEAAACTTLSILRRAAQLAIDFETSNVQQFFDNTALKAALYLMFGVKNKLTEADLTKLPVDYVEVVRQHLHFATSEQLDTVLTYIAAAREKIKECNGTQCALSAKDYDSTRALIQEKLGMSSSRGQYSWPPTSQTLIKRFNGYWNDALQSIGLKPQRGRARGGLKFTETDYTNALIKYRVYAQENDKTTSFAGYSEWLKSLPGNRKYPSGAAIRQRYGSWRSALATVADQQ
ncbi:adenosylhomocysteine nucleosidase [Arcanobacterium pluranimalium]|uniref:5'-methylthioadenosine/S-adenosylhomocysteine nucleosidase n=1 Tax=Arcanobacterium pluranimalium TaxID=108028 RepID=UPI001956D699|nr:5'-methylthioadenosine/S-adenosylhomocysteine nucleosidase [Arcanobacterium pluranimalium]MBM7824401.1 adenosylhomocysteine nucleosidase [Arcanobacterium pluranimalium]